ncbi:Heme oxygenase 3 protein [Thalictrum thalictroides]|uniref:heme oxygenase (biliverdin-producing) n=1 Tax=Thalictrum thalictroides TaxID=46969 RepID=A0A7J6VJE7_THATH|nr:Heme oxygenase 3 protein [Thalictrum thalictroides]
MPYKSVVVSESTTEKQLKKRYPGEAKGFVEEMRFVAMKLHTKDQAKEGEKEADVQPIMKSEPSNQGYIRFLVDSKVVYDTLESIIEKDPSFTIHHSISASSKLTVTANLSWSIVS